MRLILIALAFAGLLAGPAGAASGLPDPTAPVLAFHNGVAVLTHTDRATDLRLVRRLATRLFDTDAMTRGGMGAAYDKASPAQRAQLVDVFVRRMTARIEKDPAAGPGAQMTVVKVTPAGAGAWVVATRTTRGRAISALAWRTRSEPGGIRIVDVLKDGSSLVTLEHNVFAQELRSHDLAWVLADLTRKADSD